MQTPFRGPRIFAVLVLSCLALAAWGSVFPFLRIAALRPPPMRAVVADASGTISIANGNGNVGAPTPGSFVAISLSPGANLVSFSVRGSYVGQIAVQTTIDGTNWDTVYTQYVTSVSSPSTTGLAANATGSWTCPASGSTARLVATSWTSGTATVKMSAGAGGSYAMMRATPSTWTGAQTFAGLATFGGGAAFQSPVYFLGQTVALDGTTKTIDPSLGVDVAVTGSTSGTTIKLPAPAAANDGLILRLLYGGGASFTLDANGSTIYDAGTTVSTQTVQVSRTMVYYHGLGWFPEGLTRSYASTLYGSLAGSNSWAAANSFADLLGIGGRLTIARQSFSQNGGAIGSVALTTGSAAWVDVTGSGGGTLSIGAGSVTGQIVWLRNSGSNSVTLSGSSTTIDGASSQTFGGSTAIPIVWNGSGWVSLGYATWSNLTVFGSLTVNAKMIRTGQTFSGTGTVNAFNGSYVGFTGTSGGTLTLPSSGNLSTGQEFVIQDEGGAAATSNIVVSGSGSGNINGASTKSITTNYGRLVLRWNGTAWFGGFVFSPLFARRRRKAAEPNGTAFWI